MQNKYPIFIQSYRRSDHPQTSHALHAMGVPHYVIVEPEEEAIYRERLSSSATVLPLPAKWHEEFDCCDEYGWTKNQGVGPARNYAWYAAEQMGAERHWDMDDNINGFFRVNRNEKIRVLDGAFFRAMEDWCDRYRNVAMAGPNYWMFVPHKQKVPPYVLNTRIYSCNLIRTDLPYRWRGRYNDDTDLSLRMLKDGWVTVLFNAFVGLKAPTQTVPGGLNTDMYQVEGTLPKSAMLVRMHPDVARLSWRFGRAHHTVDYKPFRRNRLSLRDGASIPPGVDEYGMEFEYRDAAGNWSRTDVAAVLPS